MTSIGEFMLHYAAPHATTIAMVHVLCCVGLGFTGVFSNEPEVAVAMLCLAGAVGSYLWTLWVAENNDGAAMRTTQLFYATIAVCLLGAASVAVRRAVFGQRAHGEVDSDDDDDADEPPAKDAAAAPKVPLCVLIAPPPVVGSTSRRRISSSRRTSGRRAAAAPALESRWSTEPNEERAKEPGR